MQQRTRKGTTAARRKRDRQIRRSDGVDAGIRAPKLLVRQRVESYLLVRPGNVECSRDCGCRVPVWVAILRRRDRALAGDRNVHLRARYGAATTSRKRHRQIGRSRRIDNEVSVAKDPLRQSVKGDLLIGFANGEGAGHRCGRIESGVAILRCSDRALAGANNVHQRSVSRAIATG